MHKYTERFGIKIFVPVILLCLVTAYMITSFQRTPNDKKTEVVICSTIHSAHRYNPEYTYANLYDFIQKYDPDVIGVEMRKEDMGAEQAYLEQNYPNEMYECLHRFQNKRLYGFDWLGKELEGQPVPSNYWRNSSEIKKIEAELEKEVAMKFRMKKAKELQRVKEELILSASLKELNTGIYDSVNVRYYKELETAFAGTRYALLTDFYKDRNQHIVANVKEIIRLNPGKKILFITGADHRSYINHSISELDNVDVSQDYF